MEAESEAFATLRRDPLLNRGVLRCSYSKSWKNYTDKLLEEAMLSMPCSLHIATKADKNLATEKYAGQLPIFANFWLKESPEISLTIRSTG